MQTVEKRNALYDIKVHLVCSQVVDGQCAVTADSNKALLPLMQHHV